MGEDLDDYRRIFDGGDDLQAAAAVGAVFDVDVEDGTHKNTHTLMDAEGRVRELAEMGIDVQCLFPSTLYARMTEDPGFEAALFRAYNRYMGQQCAANSKRLKWAGLVPLREPREAIAALDEMLRLGASASVVFGTAGEKMLTDDSFTVFWDEFARRSLPLCVHMAASFPPFDKMVETFLDAHALSMALGSRQQRGHQSFVASCCLLLERSLTRLAYDEIHFAGLSTTSDA